MLRSHGARWLRSAVHTRRGGALVVAAWLGICLVACQAPEEYYRGNENPTGHPGPGSAGAAGTIATGTAGTSAGGTAGYMMTGTAGTSAGSTGSGGTTGAAGRGGTTGGGGATGRGGTGGTTGGGGAAGRGGAAGTGTTGNAGRGGTTGSAGRGGRGGTGAAGTAGTSGAGGANTCPSGGRLDCTAAGSLDFSPDGQIVDFSAAQWNATTARWCDANGLDGGLSAFAGTTSMATAAVDTTARNLRLNLTVAAGGYAGGRINFDSCVDARDFNAIQFTASVTAGSLTGCTWQVQIQTQNQRPTTSTPTGGTCNATTTTCERYPAATLTAATATAAPMTVRFTAFNNPSASTVPTASQIVGLQWQVNSGGGACTVELRIDNIRFVTQ